MARTVVGSAVVVREKYFWPDLQLNIWAIVMLAAAGTVLGVNAQFMVQQDRLNLGVPWIMPYGVTVGALTIFFILLELILIAQRRLLPGIVMLLSFILLVLWITGIVGTGIQMFSGPNVNNACNTYVFSNPVGGPTEQTLAWLQQQSICQSWSAVFAFWIIGSFFLIWIMVIALQVGRAQFE